MKKRNIITTTVITAMLLFSSNAFAGRYSSIVDAFNSAAKGMDDIPPPPKNYDIDYTPKGFDPPGLGGPSVRSDVPPPPSSSPSLSETFNNVAR